MSSESKAWLTGAFGWASALVSDIRAESVMTWLDGTMMVGCIILCIGTRK